MYDHDDEYPLARTTEKPNVQGLPSGLPNSGSSSYSNSNNNYYGVGSSWTQEPKKAFTYRGIEFWGGAKSKIEDTIELTEKDLVINCTGYALTPKSSKPFVSKAPTWFKVDEKYQQERAQLVHQVLLEWKDFSPPPECVGLDFWESLVKSCLKQKIKRIFCCCTGGQGRTGTALGALMLATGIMKDPADTIEYLRAAYSNKAIENTSQEMYLFNLLYDVAGLLKELDSQEDLPAEK